MLIFPCPCCGYLVFEEPPGSYDICPVCGWEDDVSQLRFPTESGAQTPLIECQAARIGRLLSTARPPAFDRDPAWRPLDPAHDEFEVSKPGVDYGTTYPDDLTELYYWR